MNDPRFQGHCFVCGKPIWEIKKTFPADHPRAGSPEKLGKPHDNAIKAELLLMSGRRITLSIHDFCQHHLEQDLPGHWKTVIKAFNYEEDTRLAKPRSQEQQARWDEFYSELATDVPLGVIATEYWKDVA